MRLLLKTIILVIFLSSACPSSCFAETKRLLVVHSYHPEYAWTGSITRGLKRALYGLDIEIRIFYMNSKRKSLQHQKEKSGQEALKIVEEFKPDAVIASDDNAQEFFAKHLAGRESPIVVFCGMNAELSQYNYPASNITGILERPHFSQSVTLLRKLVPGVRKIAFLGDDCETSSSAFDYILQFDNKSEDIEVVEVALSGTFEDWKKKILELQEKTDAICLYTYHTIKDEFGNTVDSGDIMKWTVENCKVPIIGLFSFSVDDGALCGVVESATEQGREAAAIVKAVLFDGKKIQDFPPHVARGSQSMLNLDAAQRLNIEVRDSLKEETDIIF